MGKLTINLCEELHQKIREDVAADESLTTGLLMERIIREHYEGPKPRPPDRERRPDHGLLGIGGAVPAGQAVSGGPRGASPSGIS